MMLSEALQWLELGASIVPCRGKNPGALLGPDWTNKASRDEAEIRGWWQIWPDANVGVLPHRAFILLDVDDPEALKRLEERLGSTPPTPRYFTNGEPGTARERIVFRYPSLDLRRSALGDGLELRAGKLMCVVPPSINPKSGEPYEWRTALDEASLASLPEPWVEHAKRQSSSESSEVLEVIPHGIQHDTLVSFAGTMRRRGAKTPEIAAALKEMNKRCEQPGTAEDMERIAASMKQYPSDLPVVPKQEVDLSKSLTAEQWANVIVDALQETAEASVPLPFPGLNEALDGGLRAGEVCLVAGYTSHGKSIFVDMIADKAAMQGRKIHLYLTEMTAAERGLRLLSRNCNIDFRKLRRRDLSDEDWRSIWRELNHLPYGCSIVSNWSVDDVVKHVHENRWDLAIVDLVHGFHYADERDLSKSSGALIRAAKGWHPGTVMVAAAHLNDGQMRDARSPKRPRPGLHSIKGSSSLKQDADVVMFVWLQDDEVGVPTHTGEVWIGKNRQGGFAAVEVVLKPQRMRFEELAGQRVMS